MIQRRRCIRMVAIVTLLLLGTTVISSANGQLSDKDVRSSTKMLDPKEVESRIRKLNETNKDMTLLSNFLKSKGFAPQRGPETHYGIENSSEVIKDSKKALSWLISQNYSVKSAKVHAGLLATYCDASESKSPYVFALVFPAGKFDQAIEYFIKDGKVQEAKSWKSCLRSHASDCSGACVTALGTCAISAPSVFGYLICVGINCGSCFGRRVIGCCGCDCNWKCRLFVGCCNR